MKRKKSTLPAIIPNQPLSYWCGDGAKFIAESQKNEMNRMNLIRKAEQAKKKPKGKPPKPKTIIRAKTRIVNYKSVRTINN